MIFSVLGMDPGKTVFSFAGLDETRAFVFRKRLQRYRPIGFLPDLRPRVVAMEACVGAHYAGHISQQHDDGSRLMSPLYVPPYEKNHQN